METRICTGYCGPCPKQQELGRLNRTGICSVCYAHRKYAEKYSATARGKAPRKTAREPQQSANERIDRLVDHVNREIGVAQDVPLHLRVDSGSQTNERVITLQLGESKVQKLLNLLLQ